MDVPSPALPAPPSHPWPLPPPPPGRRSGGRWRTWIALGLVVVVAASAVGALVTAGHSSDRDFRFLEKLPGGQPYHWDPCQPIHWVVHLAEAPPNAVPVVQEAVRRVSEATGIRFVYDGTTDLSIDDYETQGFELPINVIGWRPVLIDWMPHDEYTARTEHDGSFAFAYPVDGRAQEVYTYRSGVVAIDAGSPIPTDFSTRESLGPVVMHELGHVMGLAHVPEGNELMWSPQVPGASQFPDELETTFGPGDREGLRELGSGAPCGIVTAPSP